MNGDTLPERSGGQQPNAFISRRITRVIVVALGLLTATATQPQTRPPDLADANLDALAALTAAKESGHPYPTLPK